MIGIDGRSLLAPPGGVGRYVRNLVSHLAALPDLPPSLLYLDRAINPADLDLPPGSKLTVRPVVSRRGWLRVALPLAIWRDRVRLMHFPSSILPPLVPTRSVVTIYDLAFEFFPETYAPAELAMQKRAVRHASRADLVITCCRNTASDLTRLYGVPEHRVRTIPLAAESRFFDPAPAGERPPLHLAPGYLLYVGALQPRKNLARLIEGYAMARKQGLAAPLVLAGEGEAGYVAQLRALAESCRVGESVIIPGFVRESDLPALYRGALAFTYVSLYEGFGLPTLEAMAASRPVIAANTSCFPEVLGQAAVLVNPQDVGAISRALVHLGTDPRLQAEYAAHGRRQAARYSWVETARRTLAVYRELL